MRTDIVERLRYRAKWLKQSRYVCGGELESDAASDIETLREQVDRLSALLRSYGHKQRAIDAYARGDDDAIALVTTVITR